MAVRLLASAPFPEAFPSHRWPEFAFAGRSNVGKSALLNRLAGAKIARVSKTPGRTQAIHFFVVDERWVLADLPGYGFAKVPESVRRGWKDLVEAYFRNRPQLRAALLLVDPRRGVGEDERMLLDFFAAHELPVVLVYTKVDKLRRAERSALCRALPGTLGVFPTSARTGEGVPELRRELGRLVHGDEP